MKRKNHWVLFAVLLLALINLSPSEETTQVRPEDRGETLPFTPPEASDLQETGHIQVAVQMDESDFRRLEEMNRQFTVIHPVEVDLVNVPAEETYATYQRQLMKLGESPDVLLLDNVWVRRFAADGYLLPTEGYYSGSLSGEVLSASLIPNEWNGYVWGVPLDVDPYVLVYDAVKLKQLGLERPPASVDDWNVLISDFKKQRPQPYLMGLDYRDPYAAATLLWQIGGGWKPGGSEPFYAVKGNMPLSLQQLEQIQPWLLDSGAVGADSWSKFNGGELAMMILPASEAQKHTLPQMKVWTPEVQPNLASVWIRGRSYAVSSQTDNAEAAGLWISEMTSALNQMRWQNTSSRLPVLKTIYYEAAQNELPTWIPATLAAGSGAALPASPALPGQLEAFQTLTSDYLSGAINMKQYRGRLAELSQ
ncbi:MAG: extracellular solute-binding protein [Paenibacillaceae bacterium]|uniref:Extracellular solute-binding protein n=1 Tax=Paenibacillus mellifer TaxID=2937794 RepID=A0A9X1Y1C9_9BACL|nr:extracellular solute-binding protein [Paenibacillus mellifer]MBW4838481.1 extracellular solute-binding protein [Paenibacillaceae bacterium]MCK8487856.1 extracellular solute-binding protein [Paenibacillus mellifer]